MGTEQHPINHLLLTSCQASLAIKVQHPVNHLTTIKNTKATIMAATQNMTCFQSNHKFIHPDTVSLYQAVFVIGMVFILPS